MAGDPQAADERRVAARHLVQRPLTCKEHDAETFRLIRRHEVQLDRWFTQRLGYRLHVDADTARLFKTGALVEHRPLRTASGRPFHHLEYVLLALVLASTAAGPAVISLRDLVDNVRSAAAEVDIALAGDATERRALVAVLRWMIEAGLASEMHAHVDAYAADGEADAVLEVRPDRIALLPLPALVGSGDVGTLLDRADRRSATRQWMRCRLVEDPVLYRDDLAPAEWGELRRRLGEEERLLDEMFGLLVEARAEGVAAIDPSGALAGVRFPRGGTEGHAALLLLERLPARGGDQSTPTLTLPEIADEVAALAAEHARRWSKDLVNAPERLARAVVDLLVELRLAEWVTTTPARPSALPEPTALAQSAGGVEPGEPAESAGVAEPGELAESAGVAEPGEPAESVQPAGTVGLAESADVAEPAGSVGRSGGARAAATGGAGAGELRLRLLPAAARFRPVEAPTRQSTLW